ncbi:unknown [Bacteroides uniformis CAG:3]|nr:unknown [Bacteroides uniformis CAG:3]
MTHIQPSHFLKQENTICGCVLKIGLLFRKDLANFNFQLDKSYLILFLVLVDNQDGNGIREEKLISLIKKLKFA